MPRSNANAEPKLPDPPRPALRRTGTSCEAGTFEHDPVDGLSVPAWVLAERRALLSKVNELRAAAGHPLIDETTLVKKAEWQAAGHSDYTTKYALYASELCRGV